MPSKRCFKKQSPSDRLTALRRGVRQKMLRHGGGIGDDVGGGGYDGGMGRLSKGGNGGSSGIGRDLVACDSHTCCVHVQKHAHVVRFPWSTVGDSSLPRVMSHLHRKQRQRKAKNKMDAQ
eukprot:4977504-Pleurochrysis_carterae.AAC.9